jgi:two-component sensor histidine kinase
VDGGALLRSVTAGAPVPVEVERSRIAFDAATAQKLGIVANELVTNAFRTAHLRSSCGSRRAGRRGCASRTAEPGRRARQASAQLVRRLVEQGLDGRFELRAAAIGTVRAPKSSFRRGRSESPRRR